MRRLLCTLALLGLIAVPASAADDKPKPNTLTPKEIAEGWILLFDGETTFGWKVDGEAEVKDGLLVLGGKKDTTATPSTNFGNFELQLALQPESSADLRFTKAVDMSVIGWRGAAGQKQPWEVGVIRWKADKLSAEFRTEAGEFAGKMESDGVTERCYPTFFVPAGNRLLLRNIKLKPLGAKSIFTGKDLTGWKEIPGRKSKFAVTDKGELNIKDGNGDIQTEGQWDDFVLQMDIISNGDHLNSGVFFRCLPGEFWSGYEAQIRNEWVTELTLRDGKKLMGSYTEKGNEVELKICEVDGKTVKVTRDVVKVPKGDITDVKHRRDLPIDFGTGGVYNRQPARRVVSTDREWFTMTVIAHGNHIATWVNGYQVADFTDDRPMDKSARKGTKLDKGPISLQGHDPTTDLSFRNIRVAELPRAEKK